MTGEPCRAYLFLPSSAAPSPSPCLRWTGAVHGPGTGSARKGEVNMIRFKAIYAAAFCLALLSPAPLLAQSVHWYQPHYMAKVEDAFNRLQFLAPHFTPAGGYNSSTHYTLTNITQGQLGINLFFTETGVKQVPQGLLGLTSIATPYRDDIVDSIPYANIEYFEIWSFGSSPTPWCVYPMGKDAGNGIICVASEETADQVADALATLSVAYGGHPSISFSLTLVTMTEKEQRKHPEQSGCMVREVDADGPAAKAGIQKSDVLHTVNGILCSPQAFGTAFAEVIAKPQGGTVRAEILRKHDTLTVDLNFPHLEIPAAQLQQQIADLSKPKEAPAATAPAQAPAAAAPSSAFHLGISVRALTDAEETTYNLPKSKGVLVTNVDKGSLAEQMQMQTGDVILAVNGSEIGDVNFFAQFVRSGAAKSFRVLRNGKTQELTVPESM